MKNKYGFGKKVDYSFDEAVDKVVEALASEGFGIITEIDVAATLKKKLGLETTSNRILGACNPSLAHQALELDPSIGLLLPCNVVVRMDEQKNTYVEVLDPTIMIDLVDNPKIKDLVDQIRERLTRVLDSL